MATASKNASTCTSVDNPAYGGLVDWTSPSNAAGASNGTNASAELDELSGPSKYLRCVFAGFAVTASKISAARVRLIGSYTAGGSVSTYYYIDRSSAALAESGELIDAPLPTLTLTLSTTIRNALVSGITLDLTILNFLSTATFLIDAIELEIDYEDGNRKRRIHRRRFPVA